MALNHERLPFRHKRVEPPPGVEPGHPPYEGGAAAVRGGIAPRQGFEPRFTESESVVLPLDDLGWYGRRASNPQPRET